jgi:hypothetical protein
MNDAERFNEIMVHHDENPVEASEKLRELWPDRVADRDRPRASQLINHLFGEKLGRWQEADRLLRELGNGDTRRAIVRSQAIAALLSGYPLDSWQAENRLLAAPECTRSQASLVVRLGVLEHLVATAAIEKTVTALLHFLTEIAAWSNYGPHADLLAGSLNNLLSTLLERADAPTQEPDYQEALNEGAKVCSRLWAVAGTWANQERAEYLVALCANKTGRFVDARNAAQCGLEIIDNGGEAQPVDRAFLLLELSRACSGLNDSAKSERARADAFRIAKEFKNPSIQQWFEKRAGLT